jgi:RHS repeat-associated protein
LHLPNGAATDDGTGWRYGLVDGLGSVRQRVDGGGQVLSVESYRPFGLPLEGEGGAPYGYTGEWWEGEAGLLYLRARWYTPSQGRLLSRDTVPGYAKRPLTQHLWLYALANPVRYVDPSGHNAKHPCYAHTENYGWFDSEHFGTGNPVGIIQNVKRVAQGASGGEIIEIKQPLHVRQYTLIYKAFYWVSDRVPDYMVDNVSLAIYKHWSIRFEDWQGRIAWGLAGASSTFSVEDLPSHYVGFFAAAETLRQREQGLITQEQKVTGQEIIEKYLGPVEWTNEEPPHQVYIYASQFLPAPEGPRLMRVPLKNYEFRPRVSDDHGLYLKDWYHKDWPEAMYIQPVTGLFCSCRPFFCELGELWWLFVREEADDLNAWEFFIGVGGGTAWDIFRDLLPW